MGQLKKPMVGQAICKEKIDGKVLLEIDHRVRRVRVGMEAQLQVHLSK